VPGACEPAEFRDTDANARALLQVLGDVRHHVLEHGGNLLLGKLVVLGQDRADVP
jgi:hypothetical protein